MPFQRDLAENSFRLLSRHHDLIENTTALRGKDIYMKIAIIAHDAKKELMVQFCSAYCGILSKHTLIATNTTGKQVSEATGLPIKRYLSGQGGAEQILALSISVSLQLLSREQDTSLCFLTSATNHKIQGRHYASLFAYPKILLCNAPYGIAKGAV